jgi:hypothetical protein
MHESSAKGIILITACGEAGSERQRKARVLKHQLLKDKETRLYNTIHGDIEFQSIPKESSLTSICKRFLPSSTS